MCSGYSDGSRRWCWWLVLIKVVIVANDEMLCMVGIMDEDICCWCCIERMSGSLYRAVGHIPEQTPDKGIFVSIPEVSIPTKHLIASRLLMWGGWKKNHPAVQRQVGGEVPWMSCSGLFEYRVKVCQLWNRVRKQRADWSEIISGLVDLQNKTMVDYDWSEDNY